LGHSRRFRDVACETALPPRTDIVQLDRACPFRAAMNRHGLVFKRHRQHVCRQQYGVNRFLTMKIEPQIVLVRTSSYT
jgi:hypothetical protein